MVKVPDFVAYDSKIVMDYIQEFANLTEIPIRAATWRA